MRLVRTGSNAAVRWSVRLSWRAWSFQNRSGSEESRRSVDARHPFFKGLQRTSVRLSFMLPQGFDGLMRGPSEVTDDRADVLPRARLTNGSALLPIDRRRENLVRCQNL